MTQSPVEASGYSDEAKRNAFAASESQDFPQQHHPSWWIPLYKDDLSVQLIFRELIDEKVERQLQLVNEVAAVVVVPAPQDE